MTPPKCEKKIAICAIKKNDYDSKTFLVVQWLGLQAPDAEGLGWSLVRELDPSYCNSAVAC